MHTRGGSPGSLGQTSRCDATHSIAGSCVEHASECRSKRDRNRVRWLTVVDEGVAYAINGG
jgi:hypothetical protein